MRTTSFNSYLSRQVYDTLVPPNHFLRELNNKIDWYELTFDLQLLAKNDHGGRPRWNPEILFKMLFLSFLFDQSDRDTEDLVTLHLACKAFLGIEVTAQAPDATTLCVFRKELVSRMGYEWLENVFQTIVRDAEAQGIAFGSVRALDSTHTVADVNTHKDRERKEVGGEPRDLDASWGVKGAEIRKTKDGTSVEVVKYFHGYKSHLLAETGHGIITGLAVSPGNTADVDAGEDLIINRLLKRMRQRIPWLAADKAYGDAVLISILEKDYGIKTALGLNGQFFKGKYKERWASYRDDPERVAARAKRYVVERVNADLKENHGLRRCRYLGLAKYRFQATMAAIAHNLKLIVRLTTGAHFRPV